MHSTSTGDVGRAMSRGSSMAAAAVVLPLPLGSDEQGTNIDDDDGEVYTKDEGIGGVVFVRRSPPFSSTPKPPLPDTDSEAKLLLLSPLLGKLLRRRGSVPSGTPPLAPGASPCRWTAETAALLVGILPTLTPVSILLSFMAFPCSRPSPAE